MFNKILLAQTAGTKLKFSPSNTMGFTSGGNYVVLSINSFTPNSSHVTLTFVEGPNAPSESNFGSASYTTSFQSSVSSVSTSGHDVAERSIEAAIVQDAINYIKGFNSGCNFEQASFSPEVQPF